MLNKDLKKLQKVIEYKFNNLEVLIAALTHKSYATDISSDVYNERMEFLGDSILSAVVAEYLYEKYSEDSEGKLSQLKAQIVSSQNLSAWAKEINLGDFILLGKSEDSQEARERESLLCDTFEALVCAVYLDGGVKEAEKFVSRFLNKQQHVVITDYKSRFQEIVQRDYKVLPEYKVEREFGPDHDKRFEVAVYVKNRLFGRGKGHSKKEAQQLAAETAIKKMLQV